MVLIAWAGAFARAVSAHGLHGFRTLDQTALLAAAAQAGRYQVYLIPVLLWWAALLILTPTGFTVAFPAATAAAAMLGYLSLPPSSFHVTARVATISHWLIRFDSHWSRYTIAFLVSSIGVAYVLQHNAASVFRKLGHFPIWPARRSHRKTDSLESVRRLCATLLILLVLLSVTWAATVARLAASQAGARGTGISHGFQTWPYQTEYLLVLVFIAACIPQFYDVKSWLIAAVALTALYSLAPIVPAFPSVLAISAGGELARISAAWGNNALWAALFIFAPAVMLGIYLVTKVLRPR
jgi:hypothetical protein